ncbi:MAG: N-acetylmuramoyl-L-alanine amidase [Roseburia sp.]|nr:N-acetylmuramoyl-L-alanine amidase [Roseburia sp.]
MNAEKRRKRRIRNMVCVLYSIIQLSIAIAGFWVLGGVLKKLDVTETVLTIQGEVIVPEEDKEEPTGPVICIDAGHGGKDNGSESGAHVEKDDNLKLAQAVAAYLKGKNVSVVMTREDDTFLSLEERCNIANQSNADYFVSLHRNDGEGYGVETWVYSGATDETVMLAEQIMAELDEAGIQRNRGVKKGTQKSESGNYYVNIHSDMPSCIVEMGFVGNAADNQLLEEKLSDYAAAIGDAILSTYEIYNGASGDASGQNPDGAGDGTAGQNTEGADGSVTGQDDGADAGTSPGQVTQAIALDGLDTTIVNWGLGRNVDEQNRPVDAVSAQEKYGAYNAVFLGEDEKSIYLTFDEGYEYGCTESILDTLKEKGVSAVFFVTEPYAKAEPGLVQRMIDEGHVVGNHSVTHPSAGIPSLSIERQQEEVMGNHQYIEENFGYDMYLFRYPAGKFSEQTLAIVNNCGYQSVLWSFAYMDYDVNNQPDEKESLQKMTDRLHPGAVYLLHAESTTNAAVLGDFIDAAREEGYTFATL